MEKVLVDSESKKVSWEFVTASRCVTDKECEFIFAYLVPVAATDDSALYDSVSVSGKLIVSLKCAAITGHPFKPPEPVYCERGLFVSIGTNVTGIFVQWRHL